MLALAASPSALRPYRRAAYRSARVPPGRVGLADEVRAALGVGKGVQLRARRSGGSSASLAEAKLLELRATSVAQSEALETLGLHEGTRLSWLGAQLHGWAQRKQRSRFVT